MNAEIFTGGGIVPVWYYTAYSEVNRMATATRSITDKSQEKQMSPEQALCTIFDIVEDQLEQMTPEARKAWLEDLSESAEKHRKHA